MQTFYKRGFTLIELLVVIAIIGILSSVVLASLNSARQKGRDARRISDIKQLQLALELYYDGTGSGEYPAAAAGTVASTLTGLTSGGYISTLPSDPGSNTYTYAAAESDNSTCTTAGEVCSSYVLKAQLETNNASALAGDVDGTVVTVTCDDGAAAPFGYCVRP